jgi:hypothetical protein
MIEDHVVIDKWNEMQIVSQTGFARVGPAELEGWQRIAQLISEERHIDFRIGTKEDHRSFGK